MTRQAISKAKRRRQLNLYKKILYTSLFAFVCISILVLTVIIRNNNQSKASASLSGSYHYETVVIKEGDSLWSIAEEHIDSYSGTARDLVNEIASVNNLETDSIITGTYILVPVYTPNY